MAYFSSITADPEDAVDVGSDDERRIRADLPLRSLGLQLHQLGQAFDERCVLFGLGLQILHLGENGFDLLVELGVDFALGQKHFTLLGWVSLYGVNTPRPRYVNNTCSNPAKATPRRTTTMR
jgi:hypothetical protein